MINKKRKPETKATPTKPEKTPPEPVKENSTTQPSAEVKSETKVEPPANQEPPKLTPLTMAKLQAGIDKLWERIQEMDIQMTDVQSQLLLKRKPTNNNKCQIRDKQTGKLYKSKNNVYQTMLKAGELKELVDKGIFGPVPEKNTFGVYALFRAYPNRFEEVHKQEQEPKA